MKNFCAFIVGILFISGAGAAPSPANVDAARQLWQLLDYIAVDYSGAVFDGTVANAGEYAEMREFSGTVARSVRDLPPQAGKDDLIRQADALETAVQQKAAATRVAAVARSLADNVLHLYPFPVAPSSAPDLQRGAQLFAQQCASCHGAQGNGDGPLAARLEPPPIAFTDHDRARARSILALYQAITQGVNGTSMPGFSSLTENDRWALAFFAGTLAYSDTMRNQGEKLWRSSETVRSQFPDLTALTRATEAGLAERMPAENARDLIAHLRSQPSTLITQQTGSLSMARTRLRESLIAFDRGDKAEATRLALSAYLDGFEPLEPLLAARNNVLLKEVESAMLDYRAAISAGAADRVASGAKTLEELFDRSEEELAPAKADGTTAFLGALTILLREGVEALLVVIGMIAFLRKAEHTEALRHVHLGWISALAAGGLTWAMATYVIGISGASREITEGASSLLAAIVLLSVGLWMHQKSSAGRWQAYLKDKLSTAMTRGSSFALFALAFVAVYREVFETVLFYSALWVDGNGTALVGGLMSGMIILAVIAWALLRTSARMSIGKFFAASSVLVAVLAVVLTGKGVAAFQEAGILGASPISFPRIELLGVYPSGETLIAQLIVGAIALGGFALNAYMSQRENSVKSSAA